MGVYVTIHGHFYQPSRENPYLETIERQSSAAPCHDWNERIYYECYRPNAFARVFDHRGRICEIVNNFEYLSFNIGPTLMSWLERFDLEVYQRILEGDRRSRERLEGHGNAIAQVYNHIIMPLANERDKYTQIRWAKADFRSRFGRDPEGIWLAETAVDYATLEALVAEGIRFTILAPSQAQRCRPLPNPDRPNPRWHEVGGAQIDPTRPYRCFVGNGGYIDIFFYDGPISRDLGFGDLLSNSQKFAARLGQAMRGDRRHAQLLNVASDGETFGHHKQSTEKCLAYAFTREFPQRNWQVTNYAHYLSQWPPTWEVQLKPATAWSCAHGVDRWQDDCGCGGGGDWHQRWRRPLRESLDWLRNRLSEIYLEAGRGLLRDPWSARDDYIQVIRDRSQANLERFFQQHQHHPLVGEERVDALRLLEMQRHALLMYTSCGWFFEELSRPEGVQILRYAARAMDLAAEVSAIHLESEFRDRLAHAESNVAALHDGARVYDRFVAPSRIGLEQIAAHYAIGSLFTEYRSQERLYCYEVSRSDYERQHLGRLSLAIGQVEVTSEITRESAKLVFAVLHLGGWDFHCCVQPFISRLSYNQLKQELLEVFKQASAARVILAMNHHGGGICFGLDDLLAEARQQLMEHASENTKNSLDCLYTQIYQDNYSILAAFHRHEIPVPRELQVAAEIALSHRCLQTIQALVAATNSQTIAYLLEELEAIATETQDSCAKLSLPEGKILFEGLMLQTLRELLEGDKATPEAVSDLERLVELGYRLGLGTAFDRCQELYQRWLRDRLQPRLEQLDTRLFNGEMATCLRLLRLGEKLGIAVDSYVESLSG